MRRQGLLGACWLAGGMLAIQFPSVQLVTLTAAALLCAVAFDHLSLRQRGPAHVLVAACAMAGGLVALTLPGLAFLWLSLAVPWLLVAKGCADIALAPTRARWDRMWGLFVLGGLIEVEVGSWAGETPAHAASALALWTGILALARGVTALTVA
ncbi:hypothetical protein HFP15_05455 [Amycolatopsis sp. K13G38]|uniref:Phosphatidate cytidylyltransferase n=1 Tax=Amycolatopsis acididurans TaxID=2724524 RepID=A0ABX1IXV4_9PSEU|nr:hypothetical protein [Amycolatopsis acididurans]NKQ52322.1 hypothetical protein [Amycolatopsis acididurans]